MPDWTYPYSIHGKFFMMFLFFSFLKRRIMAKPIKELHFYIFFWGGYIVTSANRMRVIMPQAFS